MIYPKWKYHRTEKPVVVQDEEQEASLGPGWADDPSAFGTITAPAEGQGVYDAGLDVMPDEDTQDSPSEVEAQIAALEAKRASGEATHADKLMLARLKKLLAAGV